VLLVWVAVAWFWRYSSVASMGAACSAPLLYLLGDRGPWYVERSVLLAIFVMAMVLVVKHRGNIAKLMQGTESKLGFGRKGAK
jgi:glycerol-3-phosphate acyltransferase PlsY